MTEVAVTTADATRLRELRDKIADNDRTIVKLIGVRVRLVKEVWALKQRIGLEQVNVERELWLHTYLRRTNFGSLTDRGIGHVADFLLDLTKAEIDR